MANNNCPNCGASNNHFAVKCDFCGTNLTQVPANTISTEELIASINLWIGRYIADGTLKLEHSGKEREYAPEEIEGIVNQYTGILQMRALQDRSLMPLYTEYVTKFAKKRKAKRMEVLLWIIVAFVILVGGFIAVVCLNHK